MSYWNKEKHGGLIGDKYWCDVSDMNNHSGNNYQKWHSDELIKIAQNQAWLIIDFEYHDASQWTAAHWQRLGEIFTEVRTACPWAKIGLWARHDVTLGPFFDKGGAENATGFDFYAKMYSGKVINSGYYNVGALKANAAFPFGYLKGRQSPQLLYNLMHSVECSKIYNPECLQIPTVWCEIEKVPDYDGDKADTFLEYKRSDKVIRADEKLHTPPDVIFAISLLSLTCWDGAHWFGTGANYSDDINFADEQINGQPVGEFKHTQVVRGKTFYVGYRWQYKGFVNYTVIANYICSQEPLKSIIEAEGDWIIPEYKKENTNNWQTGLKIYPSWAYGNKAPIIRLKYSSDRLKVLFIAINPTADLNTDTWSFRPTDRNWESSIELIGAWPEIGIIEL